jgi:hypothetical protein
MKNQTNKKPQVLVSGSFTDEELKELQDILLEKDIEVSEYFVKSYETGEIVRVLFRNFDAYQFLRDGILFELLVFGFTSVVSWAKRKKPKAKISTGIELRFKSKTKEIPFNVGITPDNKDHWKELEKTLTLDFVDSVKQGEIVNIYWDTQKDKIKITKM